MPIEVKQLRYAIISAELKSFSRAAKKLNMKQATLSQAIMTLEQRLGIKLFERTTRGAEPTQIGMGIIAAARRIIADLDHLRSVARALDRGESGHLALGYNSSLMAGQLRGVIFDYLHRFPGVQFDNVESSLEEMVSALLIGRIDAVITAARLDKNDFSARALWSERLMIVLNNNHRLLDQERIYWSDLLDEVFVLPGKGIGPLIGEMLNARLVGHGQKPNVRFQETSLENVLSLVSMGRFVTIATEASQGVVWPSLQFREIYDQGGTARLDFALHWRKDNDNPALQRFFSMINERYPGA